MKSFELIVPCYNEEESVNLFYETVSPKGEFVLILRGDESEEEKPLSRNERYRQKLREKEAEEAGEESGEP